MNENTPAERTATSGWQRVLAATGSPLKLFALIVLVCNTLFGAAAASLGDSDAFTYTIHMFLAIVGSFVLIALWSPRSLYHPKELMELKALSEGAEADDRMMPPDRPWVATGVMVAAVSLYAVYQLITSGYIALPGWGETLCQTS